LVRLGVSTEAALGKAQGQGRKPSQAVYDQTEAHGLVYSSRLTGRTCICVYDRALPGALDASPVIEVARLAGCLASAQRHLDSDVAAKVGTSQPNLGQDSTEAV
jgi:hypothetical protein